jgi:DNA-binding HxlR family transcriptional regulator
MGAGWRYAMLRHPARTTQEDRDETFEQQERLRRGGDAVRDGRHLEAHHPVPSAARQKALWRAGPQIGGITQRMLTLQLRELEEAGIVERTVYAEVPPRVDYALTELGRSLQPVLIAMRNWGTYRASTCQDEPMRCTMDSEAACR